MIGVGVFVCVGVVREMKTAVEVRVEEEHHAAGAHHRVVEPAAPAGGGVGGIVNHDVEHEDRQALRHGQRHEDLVAWMREQYSSRQQRQKHRHCPCPYGDSWVQLHAANSSIPFSHSIGVVAFPAVP